jgi:hypothetical protein
MRLHHGWSVQSVIYDDGLRHLTFSRVASGIALPPIVSKSPRAVIGKPDPGLSVKFAPNDLSAFQPIVRIKPASKRSPSK